MGIADSMKGIADDIITSYDLRVKAIGELVSNVHKTLKGFQKDHKEMSDTLKENLGKGEANRLETFKDMMGNIQKDIKGIEAYVKNKLKEFSDAHAEMSEALKKDLAKYVAGIVSGTKKLLGGFKDESKKMAANWQALTATMAKKSGVKPRVGAKVKVRPVKEAIEEEKLGKEEKEILSILEDYPEGATLTEIADEMGVHFASLIRPMGRLVDEDKVEKRDNRYLLA